MKSTEFCYWLQGSFELHEVIEFNIKETKIIKEHLDLVFKYDNQPNSFCYFLKGFFSSNIEKIDFNNTMIIKSELSNIFKNTIDPSYPQNEIPQLNKIHNDNKGTLRC